MIQRSDALSCGRVERPCLLLTRCLRLAPLLRVLLVGHVLLLLVHHHIVDGLDWASDIGELPLQPDVHDVHVDIDRVVAVVTIHIK